MGKIIEWDNNGITSEERFSCCEGTPGWPMIKGLPNDSWIKNCRIHHNTLNQRTLPHIYLLMVHITHWDSAIELFYNRWRYISSASKQCKQEVVINLNHQLKAQLLIVFGYMIILLDLSQCKCSVIVVIY